MAAAIYLTNVSGGCCLTKIDSGVNNQTCIGSASQKWIAEPGPQERQIALKSTENGKYLVAVSGAAYGTITTGEKQYWTLESGAAHGSYWLKCNDYPNAYLASKGGNFITNNPIFCWPKQAVLTHALTWYLQDTTATDFVPNAQALAGAQVVEKQKSALAEMETTMKKNEAAFADREAQAKKNEAVRLEKEAELQRLEATAVEREAGLNKKEEELAQKEMEIARLQQDVKEASRQPNGSSTLSPAAVATKEVTLRLKEADLAMKENAQAQTNGAGTGLSNGTGLEAENARLKAEIERLNDPLRLTQRSEGGAMRVVKQPGFNLSGGFDPVLLARFEEGKKAMQRNMF